MWRAGRSAPCAGSRRAAATATTSRSPPPARSTTTRGATSCRRASSATATSRSTGSRSRSAAATRPGHVGSSYLGQVRALAASVWSEPMQRFLVEEAERFDAILLAPYLFGTTFWSAAAEPARALLVPCLHDEREARTAPMRALLGRVRGCLFLSRAEEALARTLAPVRASRVVGVGRGRRCRRSTTPAWPRSAPRWARAPVRRLGRPRRGGQARRRPRRADGAPPAPPRRPRPGAGRLRAVSSAGLGAAARLPRRRGQARPSWPGAVGLGLGVADGELLAGAARGLERGHADPVRRRLRADGRAHARRRRRSRLPRRRVVLGRPADAGRARRARAVRHRGPRLRARPVQLGRRPRAVPRRRRGAGMRHRDRRDTAGAAADRHRHVPARHDLGLRPDAARARDRRAVDGRPHRDGRPRASTSTRRRASCAATAACAARSCSAAS